MNRLVIRFIALLILNSLFFSACSSTPAVSTQNNQPTEQATETSPTVAPPTPTSQIATTHVAIDGDAGDWGTYPVNMTDPAGDQEDGYPDIIDAHYFKNDKYLYVLINIGETGNWNKLGIHFVTEGGGEGQISILQPYRATIRGESGSSPVDVSLKFAEGGSYEVKIALSKLPGEIVDIDAIGFALSTNGNDVYGDIINSPVQALQTVDELEVINETLVRIDGDADDWADYEDIANPSPNDVPEGAVDIVNVQSFNNEEYLYLAITQQDPALFSKYAAVVRTDEDGTPDFYIGFHPGQNLAVFGPFDAQSFSPAAGVEFSQGEIVEVKIPLALFGSRPVLYVHLQTEIVNGPVADGFDFVPQMTDETEPAEALASVIGPTTSGLIAADETWSGEIHLTGDITLTGGATLTIEPGTTVFLASNSDDQHTGQEHYDGYISEHSDPVGSEEWDQNAIRIDGRGGILHFVGTSDNPIVFKPEGSSTSSAQWDGIYIERGTIQYAKVLYAGRTAIQPLGFLGEPIEIAYNEVRFFHWAGIDSHTPNVWIHHNVVEGGGHQCITGASGNVIEFNFMTHCQNAMFVVGVDVMVRNNIAVDTARGIQVGADGRIPAGSAITFSNNTVAWLQGPPDGWYYQGELVYPSFDTGGGLDVFQADLKLTMENNIVYGPFSWGIGLHETLGAGSSVDYNLIFGTDDNYMGSGIGAIGSHNIFADPQLAEDYRLLPTSAAIDAGAPATLDADGSPADLGAFGGPDAGGW